MRRKVLGLVSVFAALVWGAVVLAEPGEPSSAVFGAGEQKILVAPSGKARLTILAQGKNAFVAKLWMAGGAKVPEHRDPTEETIVVLTGAGTIWIEDHPTRVGPGSSVFMAAGAKVRFENGKDPMEAIQVFSGVESAGKYKSWVEEK